MEKYLPVTMARHAYIIEDSIVDPQNRTMTTLTWNISHARMMVRVTDWDFEPVTVFSHGMCDRPGFEMWVSCWSVTVLAR